MPKLKSNRGAMKRLKVTGSGKIRRQKTGRRHLLTGKARGAKRKMRKGTQIHKRDEPIVRQLAPYLDRFR